MLNPFMVDKALLQMDDGRILGRLGCNGKWMHIGRFHLKFEAWTVEKHSKPEFWVGYVGWIQIMNVPLHYKKLQTFKAIGENFGDMIRVASKALGMLDCSSSFIEIRKNSCGFIPTFIEIHDKFLCKKFLRFGDIISIDPSFLVQSFGGILNSSDF